jgi:predicted permease
MRDWKQYVRERISLPRLKGLRETEIVEELAGQLEDCYREALAGGADEEAAMAAVERHIRDWEGFSGDLGDGERPRQVSRKTLWAEEASRDLRRRGPVGIWLADLGMDLRQAVRVLMRSPGFAAVAMISLALGIGVNTAVFSLYSALFLRDLPVEAPQELVEVYWGDGGLQYGPFSVPDFRDLRTWTRDSFSEMAAYDFAIGILEDEEGSEYVYGEAVSDTYFEMMGVRPQLGRLFLSDQDDRPESPPVIVLSDRGWRRRFGADPDVLGRTVRISGVDYTVVGVAPRDFPGLLPMKAEYWVCLGHDPMVGGGIASIENRSAKFLFSVKGRLRPGVGLAAARAAVLAAGERLREVQPGEWRLSVLPVRDIGIHAMIDQPIRMVGLVLLAMVGLALLVACTNLAGMLLARATVRQREIAVRMALGSGRGRLVRQLLTESLLLALLGGIPAVAVAALLMHLVVTLQPPFPIPLTLDLRLDGGVLGYALLLTVATGLFFGILPALKASRPDLLSVLKNETRPNLWGRRLRLRGLLVIAQVAVSTVLLIASGLFVRSLLNFHRVDPGFTLRQGFVAVFNTGVRHYDQERTEYFFDELKTRIESQPGVISAACISALPLGPGVRISTVGIPPSTETPDPAGLPSDVADIGEGYLATLGIPLLRGREFRTDDGREGVGAVIVNQTLAERLWPGEEPLGKRITIRSYPDREWEVVGVAANGKYRTLGEPPRSFVYVPWRAIPSTSGVTLSLVVATTGEPARYEQGFRETVRMIDPGMPVFEFKTITRHLQIMTFVPRLLAGLIGSLGLLALGLGLIGLYGMIAFDVARRTREMGIRIALGAHRGRVLRDVVTDGVRVAGTGLVIGLVLSLLVTRLLGSLLYGIDPSDPLTFGVIAGLLLAVSVAAAWGPARRAALLDPVEALRYE